MTGGCIGIIWGHTKEGNVHKGYIGLASGQDEESDILHIARFGAKFYKSEFDALQP